MSNSERSNHKPLETIFSKPLHTAPKRLQRMLLRLQRYDLHVSYQRGTEMHIADMLSRAYLKGKPSVCALQFQDVEPTDELSESPERLEAMQSATASDPVLRSLCEVVKHGWPHGRSMLKPELYPYFHIRDEITVQNGLLFKANRVLDLPSLRPDILKRIHDGYLGIQSCLRRARYDVYWPRMNQEVRDYVSKCATCCAHQPKQGQEPMLPHGVPNSAWSKVAVDLL